MPASTRSAPSDVAALRHARRLLAQHPVIDGHNDLPWAIRESDDGARATSTPTTSASRRRAHTDLARLKKGGVGAQFWSIYIPGEIKDRATRASSSSRSTSRAG